VIVYNAKNRGSPYTRIMKIDIHNEYNKKAVRSQRLIQMEMEYIPAPSVIVFWKPRRVWHHMQWHQQKNNNKKKKNIYHSSG
jgi:hypothetical protein